MKRFKTPRLPLFLIAALGFAVGWHVFLKMRLERLTLSRTEKTTVVESELRHKIVLQNFEHRLQYQEQLATSIDAFIRSSYMVRPDEFRQFLLKSGVWNHDAAPRLVVILGDNVDASLYSSAAKGFKFHEDLGDLLRQHDGSILTRNKDEALLVRIFHLSPDSRQRIEGKSTGRPMSLVFLFDGKSLMEDLVDQLPSATRLTIRNNTLDIEGEDQWTFEPQTPSTGPTLPYSYALQVGNLSWDIAWHEAAPQVEVRHSAFVKEMVGLVLSIVSGLVLLGLALYPTPSKQLKPPPLDLFFKIDAPVWHLDVNGFIVDLNEAALAYTKRGRDELIGLVRIQDIVKGRTVALTNASTGLAHGETLAFGPWAMDVESRAPSVEGARSKQERTATPAPTPAAVGPAEPKPLPAETSKPEDDGFDLNHFKSLTGSDIHVLQEVRKISLKSLPIQFENLRELVKQGDSRKIMLAAHTLKSSLSLLGSKAARDICFKIENNQLNGLSLEAWVDRMDPLVQKITRELKEVHFEEPESKSESKTEENPFKRKKAS